MPPSTHSLCQANTNTISIEYLIAVLIVRVEVAKYLYLHYLTLKSLASYYPPPYAGYSRAYTSHSYYIARKAVPVFAVIDIAYHYYSVTHNAQ